MSSLLTLLRYHVQPAPGAAPEGIQDTAGRFVLDTRGRFLLDTYDASTAFPQAAVLDDFDRADAPTLGPDWSADPLSLGLDIPPIVSGKAAYVDASVDASWNVEMLGRGRWPRAAARRVT